MNLKSKYLEYILPAILIFSFACKKKETSSHYIWQDESLFAQLTPYLESAAERSQRQDSLQVSMTAIEILVIDTSRIDTLEIFGWEEKSIFNRKDSVWYERPIHVGAFQAYCIAQERGFSIIKYSSHDLSTDSSVASMKSMMPHEISEKFIAVSDSVQSARIEYLYTKNKVKWEMHSKGAYFPGY